MAKIGCKVLTIVLTMFLILNIIVQSKPSEKELVEFKNEFEKKISIKVDQEPLEEFFVRLGKKCKISIVASSQVNLQSIVQLSFTDTSIRDIIDWTCKKYSLDYEIKRGALFFLTLDESLKKNGIFKTYDILFLQNVPIKNYFDLSYPLEFTNTSVAIMDATAGDDADPVLFIGKKLNEIIKDKIPEGNWSSSETLVEVSGNILRIKNTPEIHEQVEVILKHYYEKFGVQVQSEITILAVPKKEFNEYILNELNGSNVLSEKEFVEFITKKRLLWQNQKVLFSGSSINYNSYLSKISISNRKDILRDFNVIDNEYAPIMESMGSDDGVCITPIVNRDQTEIVLTIKGQYVPSIELVTPKLDIKNQANSIDKFQLEIAKFGTSAQIKNGGGVLISMGSNALKDMGDQLLVFCITSKVNKK